MELLNEQLNHYLSDNQGGANAASTPMWMTYMDAFTKFVEQSGKRLERYKTYEEMDKYPELRLALDIISTEIFAFDPITNSPFTIDTNNKVPDNILSKKIKQFTNVLKLKEILPFAVRQSLKYGDSFYFVVKDKEGKLAGLRRIENKDIDFIEYDEIGIAPLNYYISKKKIDAAQLGSYLAFLKFQNLETASNEKMAGVHAKDGEEFYLIPRKLMVRFMNRGQNSQFFPFGESYLEGLFPIWKKVSLLEDSLVIYRIVRAPERRAFYIDVGKAPAKIAEKVVTQTKDEIKRRRTAATQENQELGIASSFNPLSMQEDYFFAQRCLSLDTEVPLLDGRTLTLNELIDEYNEGKVNFTYSVDRKTGKMIPGEIEWAGVTRKNAELVKVVLDNNEEVICTPDHKFVLRDGSYCEAQYLNGKSMMPLYRKNNNYSKNKKGYEMVLDNVTGKWKFTHLEVTPKLKENTVIHHIDCDSRNNSPENLVEMDIEEHKELHRSLGSYHLTNAWKDDKKRKNIVDGIRKYWDNLSEDEKAKRNEVSRLNGLQTHINGIVTTENARKVYNEKFHNDLEFQKEVRRKWKEAANRPELIEANRRRRVEYNKKAKSYTITETLFELFVDYYKENSPSNLEEIKKGLRDYKPFYDTFMDTNQELASDKIRYIDEHGFACIARICKVGGYENYNAFKQEFKNNHKVVEVVFLTHCEDTGCLTIKDPGENHNFAVASGVYVKNSDGRGSRIETLPGASNLGEISDVHYFYKKLLAGMRVPSSYFNSEAPPTWNDGKVGAALAEEARFGKWLTEIREQYLWDFKVLFMQFLAETGIELPPEDLEMQWKESINVVENQELEKMVQRQSVFTGFPMEQFSPQFLQRKVLGWSDEEIQENMTSLVQWQKYKDQHGLM